jgi:hypothetical protein
VNREEETSELGLGRQSLIDCQTDYSPNNPKVFITNMEALTTSTNPTAVDDRRLGRLRHQGLRLPLGLRPLLVGRRLSCRLGHNTYALVQFVQNQSGRESRD